MRNSWREAMPKRTVEAFDRGPAVAGLRITAAAKTDDPVEMLIYDYIGSDGWGGGVAPSDVVAALANAGSSPVRVRINSPGGSVFDGLAIYNALKNHAPGVECVVDGIAASAASFIAMAGGKITMPDSSMMMIHNASTLEWGNKADMRKTADLLDKIDAQLVGIYSARTGKPAADIAAMMDAETYMTGDEAAASGFCDTVTKSAASDKSAKTATAEQAAQITAEAPQTQAAANLLPLEMAKLRARIAEAQ